MTVELNKSQRKVADKIADNRPAIQEFMNKNITSFEKKMSGPQIYAALADSLGGLSQSEFQMALSNSIKGGLIEGFEGIRGKHGGYVPVESEKPKGEVADGVDSPKNNMTIDIGGGLSLVSYDAMNWAIVGLTTKYYYNTLEMAIRGIAKKALNNEIKTLANNHSLDSIVEVIGQAERNIIERFEKTLKHKIEEVAAE
jgi:hypothetical protein